MRRRSLILLVLTLVVLLGAAAGVYAYDRGRETRIAEGVRIGGVDVGGLETRAARAKLRGALLAPLERPVRVRWRDRRFTLTPKAASVSADLDASVSEALGASRDGNALSRTVRAITGGTVDAAVDVQVSHSERAIDRLVRRVRSAVDREARDAELDLETGRVDPTRSRKGRRVRVSRLRREVTAALLDPARATASVRVRTRKVQPEVTRADLERRYPAIVVIDRGGFRLTLYKDLEVAKTYPIAVGQVGLETPAGLYDIQNKAVDPAWHVPNSDWAGDLAGEVISGDDPSNPIKARWLGIYDGVGIHGTDAESSIGTQASHGCNRLRIPDVKELYPQVPVGAPVYIA